MSQRLDPPSLRAAVIGFGEMGAHHARVMSELSGVDLVAIVDPRFAGDYWYRVPILASVEEVESLAIDLAVVATPTVTHAHLALRLCEMRIATLVEKPLAPDTETCRALEQAFSSAGIVGCVGHTERFNPAIRGMKERLQAGQLGAELYQLATRRQGPLPQRAKDVGVVLDLATHDLDLVSWVTGEGYESVIALGSQQDDGEHEDLVIITGTLGNGALTSHLVNWLSPLKERVVVATGTRGAMVADTLSGDLYHYKYGAEPVEWDSVAAFGGAVQGDVVRYALRKQEPLQCELEAFRDVLLGEPAEVVTMTDAAQTVAVAEAVQASMRDRGAPTSCEGRQHLDR